MTQDTGKRAAIYTRISQAKADVDKVADQQAEMRELAASHGYQVIDVHEDDDITAYKGKAARPGYVALLAGLRAGLYDVVLATEPQRLTRGSTAELEALNIELVRANAVLHTRAAGLQNPKSAMVAAMMAIQDVIGGLEVALKTDRQQARNRADVAKGLPVKGVRPFGWEPQRAVLTPERAQELGWTLTPLEEGSGAAYVPARASEAITIQTAIRRILDQKDAPTLWQLAREWTAAGITTDAMGRERKVRGEPKRVKVIPRVWTATTVRQVLTRPRNAGILVSNGVEMPHSRIEPLVSVQDFRDMLTVLDKRAAAVAPKPGPKPSYLLGGILECACGERMHATISHSKRRDGPTHRYQIYKCRVMATDKTQPHSSMQMSMADDTVTLRVIHQLIADGIETPDDAQWTAAMEATTAGLIALEAEITQARAVLFDPDLKAEHSHAKALLKVHHATRGALEAERDQLNAQRAEGGAFASLAALWEAIPPELRASPGAVLPSFQEHLAITAGWGYFEMLPLEKRREIVRGTVRVRLTVGGRGPSRLQFARVGTDVFQPYAREGGGVLLPSKS